MNITWIGSPNFDTNRTNIDEIFIHWIVGPLSAADSTFQKGGGTSAHYGIEDDQVHQYVKEENVAYHAGVYSHNQRSIGIEHSAAPDRPASDKTYETSARLIAEISKRHNIPLDRAHVRGHKEIRNTQCPGTMDIDRLINLATTFLGTSTDTQSIIDELRLARDNNWNLYQAQIQETQKKQERIEELEAEIAQLKTDKENLTKDVNLAEEMAGSLLKQLEKYNDEDKSTSEQLLNAEHALQPYKDELQAIKTELNLQENESIVEAVTALKASKVTQAPKPKSFLDRLIFLFS